MDTFTTAKLTSEGAKKVLETALREAEKTGRPVSVAVVDEAGYLLAFSRTDDAELYTVRIAVTKARGAALTRFRTGRESPTGNIRDDHQSLAVTLVAGTDSFTPVAGGEPILSGGRLVGGVGISGAGHADKDIVKVAAAVIA